MLHRVLPDELTLTIILLCMHDCRQRAAAVVTGAAGGIGSAVAAALGADGYAVAGIDLTPPAAVDLSLVADVTDAGAVESAVAQVESTLGPVDALVNVAGVLRPGDLVDLAPADWAESLAVNATAVLLVSQSVARRMRPRRRGAIVTVSSNAATTPRIGLGAYAASKAAASALTRVLGLELAASGIRCNIVSPGSTDTPMLRSLWSEHDETSMRGRVVAGSPDAFRLGVPLGRVADPLDVAAAVQFLVSDAARHITLHDLRVDGGATLDA